MDSTSSSANKSGPIWAIFAGREDTLGRPDSPTPNGLLALLRAGRETWNLWRMDWPTIPVDLSGWNLQKSALDFSGYNFGDDSRFVGTKFGDNTNFRRATFGIRAEFLRAEFGSSANFQGATFSGSAVFQNARFSLWPNFRGATFYGEADFFGANLSVRADFSGVLFAGKVRFANATFESDANFFCAQLGEVEIDFTKAVLGSQAKFDGAQFPDVATFNLATFGNRSTFDGRDIKTAESYWREWSIDDAAIKARISRAGRYVNPCRTFRILSCVGARFKGRVSFQNREFEGATDFGPFVHDKDTKPVLEVTVFEGAPEFHGSKLHQNTTFNECIFLAEPGPVATLAYRTLRTAMANLQAIRDEQRFFRLEMESENVHIHGFRRTLFSCYKVLSDYGFSVTRPLVFWACTMAAIGFVDAMLIAPEALAPGGERHPVSLWVQYILFNGLPLPGFDKLQLDLRGRLFGTDNQFRILVVIGFDLIHKACSLAALFLMGLAIRNLFKMKN